MLVCGLKLTGRYDRINAKYRFPKFENRSDIMGLRFRKTISILPGVRVNLGKSTQSISVGVPGFRKTFNTKGQVTTTVGLPGTGLYYVDTKNPKKEAARKKKEAEKRVAARPEAVLPKQTVIEPVQAQPKAAPQRVMPQIQRRPLQFSQPAPKQVSTENLHSIHKYADDTIDWNEVLALPTPPDPSYNEDMWSYYHSVASTVLEGDIDTYLSVIYEVNPLDDLLDFGSGFVFGTDDASKMEIEFTVNEDALADLKNSVRPAQYHEILQDFVCSASIRIARDIFALLPVETAIVHAELGDNTILSVSFDRATMNKIRFGMIDPSDTMARFRCNMDFDLLSGFHCVGRLE